MLHPFQIFCQALILHTKCVDRKQYNLTHLVKTIPLLYCHNLDEMAIFLCIISSPLFFRTIFPTQTRYNYNIIICITCSPVMHALNLLHQHFFHAVPH